MSGVPPYATLVRAPNPGPMTLDGTNSWVLTGSDGVVVVDPGPLDEGHLGALAGHAPVRLVLLTHGHPDHAEGLPRFRELVGAPTQALDPALCSPGEPALEDGLTVTVAGLPELRVLATPGHSSDSVSFLVADERAPALLTGDTLLGRGSTVVYHPDGRLGDYLDSLRRLRGLAEDLPGLVLLTGHGPVRDDALAACEQYLEHRMERLAQVEEALGKGAETAADVVRIVYADVDRTLWPAAELSVRAQLDYLSERAG